MKKWDIVALLLLCLLLVGCKKGAETAIPDNSEPTETSSPVGEQTFSQDPASVDDPGSDPPTLIDDPTSVEGSGVEGVFHSDFMGISFMLPEGWKALDQVEIAGRMGGNEAYAKAKAEDILASHIPYVELWAMDRVGNSVQLMVENPPISLMDGTTAETAAAYMDRNAAYLPNYYRDLGLEISSEERGTAQHFGYEFEYFSYVSENGIEFMTQAMMATEKDGHICTIYITSIGEDRTQELLACFMPDD